MNNNFHITIGTILTLISAIAAVMNGQAGTLQNYQNLAAIAVIAIPGMVTMLSGMFPKFKGIIQDIGKLALSFFTHLPDTVKPDAVVPNDKVDVVTPVTPISVNTKVGKPVQTLVVQAPPPEMVISKLGKDGLYDLAQIHQCDLDALNHLTIRAEDCSTAEKRRLLTACSRLNTILFNMHHGIIDKDPPIGGLVEVLGDKQGNSSNN